VLRDFQLQITSDIYIDNCQWRFWKINHVLRFNDVYTKVLRCKVTKFKPHIGASPYLRSWRYSSLKFCDIYTAACMILWQNHARSDFQEPQANCESVCASESCRLHESFFRGALIKNKNGRVCHILQPRSEYSVSTQIRTLNLHNRKQKRHPLDGSVQGLSHLISRSCLKCSYVIMSNYHKPYNII
jgi:hypothetical protein